jgi:hypothetical protein
MKFQLPVFVLAAVAAQSALAVPMDLATAKAKVASVPAANIVRISGASAVVLQVRAAVAKSCAGGIDAIFIPGTAAAVPGGNNFAYVCTGAAGSTFDGQSFLVLHSVNGGSANSVLAMAGNVVPWVGKTQIAAAGCGATTAENTTLDANVFGGCAAAEAAPSHGGPSDVEAAAFGSVLTPTANLQVATTSAGQGFGIIASEALYRAMSAAQGLPADCRDDTRSATPVANTRVIVGADDYSPACQPNITRAQYTTLVGQGQAASLVGSADPWKVVGVSAPTENVNLCRRVPTSGTQAASNLYFLGTNCTSSHPLTQPSTFNDAAGKYFVQENSGTADVLNCVNLGTKTGTPTTVGSVSGNFRIGVVSLENKPSSTASWNFLKLNGVSPTEDALQRASTIEGRYDFAFDSAMHTDGVLTPANSAAYLGGLALTLGGDPSDAGTVDVTGVYISPLGGFFNKDFPARVAKGTRDGNSCQPFREAFEAPPL